MLSLTRLPQSNGTTSGRLSGYCRPGRIAADARAHAEAAANRQARQWAPASRSADFIPLLLLVVLTAYSLLTSCTTSHAAPEAHNVKAEHAAPAHGRTDWYNADSAED